MKLYEIVNPSDPYTMYADDNAVAMVAVVLLGEGKFAARGPDGFTTGLLLFATEAEIKTAFRGILGTDDIAAWLTGPRRAAVANALESVMIGRPSERGVFDALMVALPEAQREEKRAELYNQRRSSMANIGAWAWAKAARLREGGS